MTDEKRLLHDLRAEIDSDTESGAWRNGAHWAIGRIEAELLAAVYAHEWKIAPDGATVIDVPWLLHLLNDPRARAAADEVPS